ncbi:MAG: hypothetical protein M3203_12455, partial [Actinomycetota bacterium]|nr:hypothetical protein [Actinomycetota bacterium]
MVQEPGPPSVPTEPDGADAATQLRARTGRRLVVAALVLFLALGAVDVFGVRTRQRSASRGGYELSVEYASVSRPGLATPWSFEVRRPGGFPDGLTIAALSKYFDAFDENGFSPSPSEETADTERTIWRFGPSTSDTLAVSLDARVAPDVQLTRVRGRVE